MSDRRSNLEDLFKEVAKLTSNHDSVHFSTGNKEFDIDIAVVYPDKLGEALQKVDPEWWKNA